MPGQLAEPQCYHDAFHSGIRPDPIQTIAEWADANMVLPSWASEPGRWRTSRVPFMREPMECLSPSSPVNDVVLMKCTQIAGTETAKNVIGFTIDRAPASMMLVEPTVDVAKKVSKQKIQPMLDEVPCLAGKVREARSRDSGNTILAKDFPGGMLVLTGANSGIGLRFMSAKILILDEIDAYPLDVDGEGHPAELAKERQATFANYKCFELSTPKEKATSRIEPAYEAGSRGKFHVPCPLCLHRQALVWAQLKWPSGRPDQAAYECEGCRQMIAEHHKTFMLESGQWVHQDPANPVRSFHINALYQPYGWKDSWPTLAKRWVRIHRKRDVAALKVFVNTKLAETWQEKGEKVEADAIKERREIYPAQVPAGVLLLTAAVDVQDDRLEAECKGVGLDEESWSIDYQRWMGSPGQKDVWAQLEHWRQKTFRHASGVPMKIQALTVDTGGHHSKEAYAYVRKHQAERVFAVKGSNQPGARLVTMGSKDNLGRVRLFMVGTDSAKDTIFSRLKLDTPGPGYMHFPQGVRDADGRISPLEQYDEEYFAQLTAEERREKIEKGVLVGYHYQKVRGRNEALDLTVYNLAALAILNVDLDALAKQIEQERSGPMAPAPRDSEESDRTSGWVRRRGGWLKR